MLARNTARLPDWIEIVVTSRPETDVVVPLQGLNPFVLDTTTESNAVDIRDYLRRELAPNLQIRPYASRLVKQVLEKSEGISRKDIRPGLRTILAAYEPLPTGILSWLFSWRSEELRDFLQMLGSLFPTMTAGGQELVRPCHSHSGIGCQLVHG